MTDQLLSDESTPPSGPLSASDSASSSQVALLQSKRDAVGLSVRLRAPKSSSQTAANTAPTLDGLPEELLHNVLRFVQSQRDFLSLCRTSSRYNRAASPRLYSSFKHELYQQPERLHSFLRNIVRRPDLADCVSHVTLTHQQRGKSFYDLRTWREWAIKSYKPELSEEDVELFQEGARELQLQLHDALEIISRKEEAQAALMLSHTRNVTELSLNIPNVNDSRLLLNILKETTDRGTALQNLRKFTGIYYNFDGESQGGFELAPISSLFRLPKIQSIYAIACLEPEDDAFRGFDCEEGTSNVVEIQFHRSSVCPKAMSLMLAAPRALKRFYCDWGGHTVGWSEINFPTIGRALQKQARSLESLTLDVKKHYHTWPEAEDGLVPPLGSFAGFERLTHIDVPGAALIGWDEASVGGYARLMDILPTCIATLKVNQWTPGIGEQLQELADVVIANFPDLQEICLEGPPEDVSEVKLQKLFNARGSQVTVRISDGDEVNHFE